MPGLHSSNCTFKHLPQRKVTSVQALTCKRVLLDSSIRNSSNMIYDSLNVWMGKQRMGYLYSRILIAVNPNEWNAIHTSTWMRLKIMMLNERSQKGRGVMGSTKMHLGECRKWNSWITTESRSMFSWAWGDGKELQRDMRKVSRRWRDCYPDCGDGVCLCQNPPIHCWVLRQGLIQSLLTSGLSSWGLTLHSGSSCDEL